MKQFAKVYVIKHMNYEGIITINDVPFVFFESRNLFGYVPDKTHQFIKSIKPDIVLVQGFIFPIQLRRLRRLLGNDCVIMVQHHGEKPFNWPKRIFQHIADPHTSAYLFTSIGNARDWIDKRIIKNSGKCYEVQAASTHFIKQDRPACKVRLGISGDFNFLWVGRLNDNKDPLTLLRAFLQYVNLNPGARLYMIYQSDDLLPELRSFLERNQLLKSVVFLVGKIDHQELVYWYSAVEYYISASQYEGCGFALIEAMSCGCIPIVTDIPSFRKITGDGSYGLMYKPGDPQSLLSVLNELEKIPSEDFAANVMKYFEQKLSFRSIAENLYRCSQNLITK